MASWRRVADRASAPGRWASALALVLALGFSGAAAVANIRAPRTEPAMPSSAAQPSAGPAKLSVLREDLTFRCHEKVCQVVASYVVQADQALTVGLDFMLPINAPVVARVGSVPAVPTVVSAEMLAVDLDQKLRLHHRYIMPDGARLPPLYRASVLVALVAGRNQITFEYDQPLAAIEHGHSYFSKGRMLPEFFYLLWPLKEWTRAPDFAIDLRVDADRPAPSWWKRTFGHPVKIACDQLSGSQQQQGEQLLFRARLADPFPDVLHCRIGEDDLL